MEQEVPTWLDERFLERVLLEGRDGEASVTIVQFCASRAVGVGNNYTSNILRVNVNYTLTPSTNSKSISLIIKIPTLMEEFEKLNLYDKELKIYSEVLPTMHEKIKREISPTLFYSPLKNILVLSDLKTDGYVMMDKYEQLGFSHCKLVFETLAEYHATSVACHHDHSTVIEEVGRENIYVKDSDADSATQMKVWIEFAVKNFADLLRQMDGLQTVADCIASKVDHIWASITDICCPQARLLNVLNHGDCWTNNLMFRHNDAGEVVDLKLLDFQIARFGSPVIDLYQFMWSSANEQVRENSQHELYNIYLKTFNETLEKLGCEETLSPEAFKEHLIAVADWIIYTMTFVLPFALCETEDVIQFDKCSLEDFQSGEVNKKFQKMQNGRRLREKVPVMARQYHYWISSLKSSS